MEWFSNPSHLVKQTDNKHLPFKLNFKDRVLKPVAEVCLSQPIYIRKPQPMANTQSIYTLLQLYRFGSTYNQAIKQKKKEKPPLKSATINQLLNRIAQLDRMVIKAPLNGRLNKYVPFLPNAPTYSLF